jgi:hypothetical protein
MRFRNIWFRELPPRAIEGGTDGYLTTEATLAKRKEIAASIREDAEGLRDGNNPLPEMLRLMESLVYEKQDAAEQRVSELAGKYVAGLKALAAGELASKRDEVRNVSGAFRYLARWKIFPATYEPATALQQIIREQRWDQRRNN